jgi:hypothetical protein
MVNRKATVRALVISVLCEAMAVKNEGYMTVLFSLVAAAWMVVVIIEIYENINQ